MKQTSKLKSFLLIALFASIAIALTYRAIIGGHFIFRK